uniref:Uncharacterized protein n=1 Tax=Pyrodinium bahamense TaxID=73915 RepID=A0A7S0A7W3_9DINO
MAETVMAQQLALEALANEVQTLQAGCGQAQPPTAPPQPSADHPAIAAIKAASPEPEGNNSVMVPCRTLLTPCGKLSLPVTLSEPLGGAQVVLRRPEDMKDWIKNADERFSQFVIISVGSGVLLYMLLKVAVPAYRRKLVERWKQIVSGRLNTDLDDLSQKERDQEMARRMDPKAETFIAPGNIYRACAVMEFDRTPLCYFIYLVAQAAAAMFMQVYLPFRIFYDIFQNWQPVGIKSPFWYTQAIMHYIALAVLMLVMTSCITGKAVEKIVTGAEANFYILTHQLPDTATGVDRPSRVRSTINKYFWCVSSMVLNVWTSVLCQAIFILKIMTYSEESLESIVSISVVIYFIFGLDSLIMDIDPKLRPNYRQAVLARSEVCAYEPIWLKVLAELARVLSKWSGYFGLLGYLVLRWRNRFTGEELGGDGLEWK